MACSKVSSNDLSAMTDGCVSLWMFVCEWARQSLQWVWTHSTLPLCLINIASPSAWLSLALEARDVRPGRLLRCPISGWKRSGGSECLPFLLLSHTRPHLASESKYEFGRSCLSASTVFINPGKVSWACPWTVLARSWAAVYTAAF